MRFAQWDAALFSATPLGGPVRAPHPNPPSPPSPLNPPRRIARPPAPLPLPTQVEGSTSEGAKPNPNADQVDGNTSVLLRGRGFRSVSQLQPQCRFGRTRVLATILGSGALRCYSNPHP